MDKKSKIFVSGASGMLGRAIMKRLLETGYQNIIGSHSPMSGQDDFIPGEQTHAFPSHMKWINQDRMNQGELDAFFCEEG